MMIAFYGRYHAPQESAAVADCLSGEVASDGAYARRLRQWFGGFGVAPLLFTPSGSHALELACHLLRLQVGDEVILPSYNFPSAANAVLLAGGVPVLCDVSPDTQSITAQSVARRVTQRTRAVIAVHYAGIACPMDELAELCEQGGFSLIEDAAQGVCAAYRGKPLGTLGRFGAYSFHSTKNYSCGEGGALLCGEPDLQAAEIFRDKGTNRTQYLRGQCDRYTWQSVGSSYVMSELSAALLHTQLAHAQTITAHRLALCGIYRTLLQPLEDQGALRIMTVPDYATPNGHIFYVRFASGALREQVQAHLLSGGIDARTHYVPLHLSPMGARLGCRPDDLPESKAAAEQLLRLPVHAQMSQEDAQRVAAEMNKAVNK